jgi:hypothetical protein
MFFKKGKKPKETGRVPKEFGGDDFGFDEEDASRRPEDSRVERPRAPLEEEEEGPALGRSVDDATFVSAARPPERSSAPAAVPRGEVDEELPDATRVIGPPVDLRTTTVAWLVVASGPGRGRDYRLGARRTRVGSAGECEIRLTGDPYVSTNHAEVSMDGEDVVVRDLGSTNGTYRNDERIQDAVLQDGDRVRFGLSEFVFKSVRL